MARCDVAAAVPGEVSLAYSHHVEQVKVADVKLLNLNLPVGYGVDTVTGLVSDAGRSGRNRVSY